MEFNNLHEQNTPLLICNVWDVKSAHAAEKVGFQAIASSSSALAHVLGYEDGEEMSFEELAYMAKRIALNTHLPFSVDLESGYSRDPLKIASNLKELAGFGVVGVNIEDSIVDGSRTLLGAEAFTEKLQAVKKQLEKDGTEIFLNIRTDAFILGLSDALEETVKRISLYEKAGANGIFVPYITKEEDIKAVVSSTHLPINVLAKPDLPDVEILQALGVKRISMGNSVFDNMHRHLEKMLTTIKRENSIKIIFS